ncbi:MAG: MFS transporter [Actinomycetota bacterium]|nr:MFS transporter [Actinomycetota bacterium]
MRGGRWLTLAVVSAGTAMLLLDVTVVNVALPAVAEDIDVTFEQAQWVIDAYALTLAATVLTAGALADRLGRRAVFAAGLVLFTLTSAACGLAQSGLQLDLARAAQGVGAAAMFAASLALLAHEFQGPERSFALGIWGAITGAALALGPLAGGALVDGPGWRWIFLVNLPIGALLVALTLARLPESREREPRPIDPAGLATFGLGCFFATFALIRGPEAGWGDAQIVVSGAGAAVLLAGFVAIERTVKAPMLPPSLFRIPAFTGTALVAFVQSLALYPLFLFLAIYFQSYLGYTPTETGLRLLPLTLVLFAVAPISGRYTSRVALRVPLTLGLVLIAAGLLLMAGLEPTDDWDRLLPGFVVGGLAIGVISPALAAAMVGVLSVDRSGLASGVNNTFRQLGIAVGIAAFGAVFTHNADGGGAQGAVDGLNTIFVAAAACALAGAAVAWPLLRGLRVSPAPGGSGPPR